MLLVLSETTVRAVLKRYETLFSGGDVEAMLEDCTDDVEVRYGSITLSKERANSARCFDGASRICATIGVETTPVSQPSPHRLVMDRQLDRRPYRRTNGSLRPRDLDRA